MRNGKIYTSWLATFERGHFCDLLGIPASEKRYLMDGHVRRTRVTLHFTRHSKDPSGVAEITEEWVRTYSKKDFFLKLGLHPDNSKHMKTIFVIMGEVQVRFISKDL